MFEKIIERNKVNIDELMNDYLIKSPSSVSKQNPILARKEYKNISNEEILKVYNKSNKISFQNELKGNIKDMFSDNLVKRLNEKDEQIKQASNKEITKKSIEELKKDGINVNAKTEKKLEEKENDGENLTEEDVKKEAIKALYEEVLDDYYKLRENLSTGKNGQVQTGNLDVDEKSGTKLVLYENYLRKIDVAYKSKYNSFIGQDDESISKKENKYEDREMKNQKHINKEANKDLIKIIELNDERENIEKDISNLSDKAALMDSDKFNKEMDLLQKEYIDKSFEIRQLSPNMLEMNRQLENREELDMFRDRLVGTNYQKKQDKAVLDKKNYNKSKEEDAFKDNLREATNKETDETVDKSIEIADKLIEESEKLVKTDPEKAAELIQSARMIKGVSGTTSIDDSKENLKEENAKEKHEEIKEKKSKYDVYDVRYECEKAVEPEENIIENYVSRIEKEINQTKEDINIEENSKEIR